MQVVPGASPETAVTGRKFSPLCLRRIPIRGLLFHKKLERGAAVDYDLQVFLMTSSSCESTVEWLIAMAGEEKPAVAKSAGAIPQETQGLDVSLLADPGRGTEDTGMLKALLQMRMMMPYVSRMMDSQGQDPGMAALSTDLKQSVGDLQLAQRDLRMTVQEQLVQMKRVEEEMNRTREATESNAFESKELVEDMKSMRSLVQKSAGALGFLLVVLIVLIVWMLAKGLR